MLINQIDRQTTRDINEQRDTDRKDISIYGQRENDTEGYKL